MSTIKQLFWNVPPYYTVILEGSRVYVRSYSAQSKGNLLSRFFNADGYLCVKMHDRRTFLHRLVAEHFLGPKPYLLVTNHKDGDKQNNAPDNLEYTTIAGNIAHSIAHGLHVCCDPTRMPTYKDGRCKNRVEYKKNWRRQRRTAGLPVT